MYIYYKLTVLDLGYSIEMEHDCVFDHYFFLFRFLFVCFFDDLRYISPQKHF